MPDDTTASDHTPPDEATCGERWASLDVAHACSWISHEGDVHKCRCGDVWDAGVVGCRAASAAPEPRRLPATMLEPCSFDDTPEPGGERTSVQLALDALDDATGDLDSLSDEDLDAVSAWANNIQLDIVRHQRIRGGSHA